MKIDLLHKSILKKLKQEYIDKIYTTLQLQKYKRKTFVVNVKNTYTLIQNPRKNPEYIQKQTKAKNKTNRNTKKKKNFFKHTKKQIPKTKTNTNLNQKQ